MSRKPSKFRKAKRAQRESKPIAARRTPVHVDFETRSAVEFHRGRYAEIGTRVHNAIARMVDHSGAVEEIITGHYHVGDTHPAEIENGQLLAYAYGAYLSGNKELTVTLMGGDVIGWADSVHHDQHFTGEKIDTGQRGRRKS